MLQQAEEEAARERVVKEASCAAQQLRPPQYKDAAEQELLTQLPLPGDIPGILRELTVVLATQTHMQHVQVPPCTRASLIQTARQKV